ncbi:MAG: DsrE family protein [Deltaproteobacteria bacterium]|nr:DsrE family protein [Deltaproteobacteria bacterium]
MGNFVFMLSKGGAGPATRCFQLAKVAHAQGHQVYVFLVDDGVYWADSSKDMSEKNPNGDCVGDYLPYLVEKEVPIGICPPCGQARKLDEAKFYANMMWDGAPHLLELASQGTVINF